MLAAVNSKDHKYDPFRFMVNGSELKKQQRAKPQTERRPMTGDEILARLQQIGFPVIDNRKHDGISESR